MRASHGTVDYILLLMKVFNLIYNPLHPDPKRLEKAVVHLCQRTGCSAAVWGQHFDVFPCMQKEETIESINASHKMIVRLAKDAALPEVCIFEDDVFFPAESGWGYWLRSKPAAYKIYLGGTYGPRNDRQADYPVGLHAYFIHSSFYNEFLSLPPYVHIDTALKGKGPFDVCYPFAAIQRKGWSANHRKEVDYNTVLCEDDIYTGVDPLFYTTNPD